ncbi:hypothetical protein BS78_08G029800 [Paspalum vaginatum]|nr:hypothetical protein BS78_08G029800 [Paspalum vaginatum]
MAALHRGGCGSVLSGLAQYRDREVLPSFNKQSRVFYGNSRDFSGTIISHAPPAAATTILRRQGVATHGSHRSNVVSAAASSSEAAEPVHKEESASSPWQQTSPASSWVERWLPTAARPYALLARLHKPGNLWFYAWPCIWSIAIATTKTELPDMKILALFGFGLVVIKCAACTVNDLLDRDFDKKVERTKNRPLASGALTPSQGFYFLVFQILLWFSFLLQLNNRSLIMGASWLVLLLTYPLMKRFTYWPQAYLGFAINFGIFLASAAIKENLDYAVILPMYFAGIFWTLVYDTIYAHQDKKDDLKAGVKSTAIRFGDNTKYWLSGFGVACISSLAFTGYNAHLAWAYYPFLAAAAGHLAWQIFTVDLSNRLDCNRKFVSNKWFGALVLGGILCGMLAS